SKKSYPVSFEESSGHLTVYDSLKLEEPYGVLPTPFKNGLLFLVTFTDHQAMFLMDNNGPPARKILTFPAFSVNGFGVCTDDDHSIFMKSQGVNVTYNCINGKWARTPTPFDSIQWSKILHDKHDNTYWVVMETEIAHYDKNFKLIRTYSQEDGLPGLRI